MARSMSTVRATSRSGKATHLGAHGPSGERASWVQRGGHCTHGTEVANAMRLAAMTFFAPHGAVPVRHAVPDIT